jgi:lipoic acid synthetase
VDVPISALRSGGARIGHVAPWIRVRMPGAGQFYPIRERLRGLGLHTVCEEARCPNMAECWGGGTATLMVLGDVCTRGCRFCSVTTGHPGAPDPCEPDKVAQATAAMGLEYVVLTAVDRDDLPDGGAAHFAACVRAIKRQDPRVLVETLTGDMLGDERALGVLAASGAEVLAHNLETVERLQPMVRDPRAGYSQSLGVLAAFKRLRPAAFTKSSLMLGLGEREEEVLRAMDDLRGVGVDILTLGQYLRPTKKHLPVVEYVEPARFAAYEAEGLARGFRFVAAGPLVRSSYRAGELFVKHLLSGGTHGR